MLIGYHYNYKYDTYINNIVEFTNNQKNYNFKIDNFFNAENNSLIIEYFHIIKNILLYVKKPNLQNIENQIFGKQTIKFLNELNSDFIKNNFMIKDDNIRAHNIIKTLIILLIYNLSDKQIYYKLLESSENIDSEYIFIDIIEPTHEYFDFNQMESLLSKKDIINGLSYEIWDYLESLQLFDIQKSHDEKILELINKNLLVPILEDFMTYHKDSEKYDSDASNTYKKKENTKIKYIINKIEQASELYSNKVLKNDKLLKLINSYFYAPLYHRQSILRNDYEEIKIINKFLNQGRINQENSEYLNDLFDYRSYPYINFKDFRKYGFSLDFNNTVDSIRVISFSKKNIKNKNSLLQLRVSMKNSQSNIVGFMINNNNIDCLKYKDTKDIREKKIEDVYQTILNNILNILTKKKKDECFLLLVI